MKLLNASNSLTQHKSKPDNNNLVTAEKKNFLNCDSSNDSCILNEPNDNKDYNLQVKYEKSLPSDMSKHANFLNETETWKSLNEIKKRGKYLTACPEIENLHKRPKCNNIATLLINGNALLPIKIGNKHIMIKNTCPFDATVQCIIGGYSEWSKYNKYIEQSCNSQFLH